MPEITLTFWSYMATWIGAMLLGVCIAVGATRDQRKDYQREYQKKHDALQDVIEKEVKGEWSRGWDDCMKSAGERTKRYFIYCREHDITEQQVESFYRKYMEGKTE